MLFEITQVWKIEDSVSGILNNTFAELWLDRVFAVLSKNINVQMTGFFNSRIVCICDFQIKKNGKKLAW